MALWRINIKTDARPGCNPRSYCLDHNLAGVGWRVADSGGNPPRDFEHYLELGREEYGDRSWTTATQIMGKRMAAGDLCWTRNAGLYYLGKIEGAWRYLSGEEADAQDIHCVRTCWWQKIGTVEAVPGAVERAFGPPRAVQQVDDPTAEAYSRYVYAGLTGDPANDHPTISKHDLFALMSPSDHEDLAALYLQVEHNLSVVPSTVRRATSTYEWVMINRLTGERAVVQVKSGNSRTDIPEFAHSGLRAFLVEADVNEADEKLPEAVTRITRNQLLDFGRRHPKLLTTRIKNYVEWIAR